MINKFLVKVDGTVHETFDLSNIDLSALSDGPHQITVEAYNGNTLVNSKTVNVTVGGSGGGGGATLDEATEMFIYEAGIPNDSSASVYSGLTNAQVVTVINNYVTGLKTQGIWDKLKIDYPLVGGNATAHAVNLKNPAAYKVLWFGDWTHNYLGAKGNGSNTYGNTQAPYTSLTGENNVSHIYDSGMTVVVGSANTPVNNYGAIQELSAQNSDSSRVSLAAMTGSSGDNLQMQFWESNTEVEYPLDAATVRGAMTIQRKVSVPEFSSFRNGVKLGTTPIGTLNTSTYFVTIGGKNRSNDVENPVFTASSCSNQEIRHASVHVGLTDAEIAAYHTLINNLNTALGRKTW